MQARAIYRGARISAFKVREVTREIQGLSASSALDVVAFSSKKAAAMISKTLRSAIANAENNVGLRVDRLVVKEATVGEGPSLKRFKSRARGSASTIVKRTSHIRIVLADDLEPTRRAVRSVAGHLKRSAAPDGSTKQVGKVVLPLDTRPENATDPETNEVAEISR